MCYKAADNYVHALGFAPDQYKTQQMSVKAVNTYFLYLILFPISMSQAMCDKAVDGNADTLKFVPDRYNTQEMCIKVVD